MNKMKWGRKKNPQSSTPSTTTTITSSPAFSTISQVFPVSWFSKLKQLSVKSKTQTGKTKEKPELFNPAKLCQGDIVHDNDAFWRLSFGGDENFDGETYRSAMYNSDNEPPLSNCGSCRNAEEDNQKFTNMVSDIRKMRQFRKENQEQGIMLDTPSWDKIRKGRKVIVRKSRRTDQKCSHSGRESNKPSPKRTTTSTELEQAEKKTKDLEPIKTKEDTENGYGSYAASGSRKSLYISPLNSAQGRGRRIEEGAEEFTALNSVSSKIQGLNVENFEDSDRKAAKESKIKDIMSKSEKQRKLTHQNRKEQMQRTKQTSKARACSPRTASKIEICKIRALEDMKKAKLKKMKRRIRLESKQDLESFAVVTCSYNPQKDFRDSMLEMIVDNKIRQPAELEELLACYLSLNSEEYHAVIINVFKQVWFDLCLSQLSPELGVTNHRYSD
ncbi:hypothetical protein MKW98_009862 [Papaver atlanticum]|uniref:Transcription repressor n=1 Tax=Papaver atlanticum TaxID=357466 RepID=A0AAD4TBD9_9MAGN|nr:hypothetical protein MKW98_009862 [Papaver atlanticum]